MARDAVQAPRSINYEEVDVFETLRRDDRRAAARTRASTRSAWRRTAPASTRIYDRAKQATCLATDRADARCARRSRRAARAARVSIPGVYGGLLDKFPFGAAFAKG